MLGVSGWYISWDVRPHLLRHRQRPLHGEVEARVQLQRAQVQRAHDLVQAEEARRERRRLIAERLQEAVRVALAVQPHDEGLRALVVAAVRVAQHEAADQVRRDDLVQQVHQQDAARHRQHAAGQVQPLALGRGDVVGDGEEARGTDGGGGGYGGGVGEGVLVEGGEALVDVALVVLGQVEHEHEVGGSGVVRDEVEEELREAQAARQDHQTVLGSEVVQDLTVEREDGEGRSGERRLGSRAFRGGGGSSDAVGHDLCPRTAEQRSYITHVGTADELLIADCSRTDRVGDGTPWQQHAWRSSESVTHIEM